MEKTRKKEFWANEAVKAAQAQLQKDLVFLDECISIGEDADELESTVNRHGEDAGKLFFGWLMLHGYSNGAEILASMVAYVMDNLYLVHNGRRKTLANATKKDLGEIITLVEFAVDEKDFNAHLNPFDGLLLFYQFLEEIGYPANLPRRQRAIKELRRTIIKKPCAVKQDGFELMQ